jgi:UDP-glucose 4-epimerase
VALRYFTVYGPRQRPDMGFHRFIRAGLRHEPITLYGDGEQTRDFTFVSDVADAFVTAANSGISGEIFNVGSDNTYSVNRLVELLGGDKVHIPKRPGEPDCTYADISKIKQVLQWEPKVRFEDGVGTMLASIEQWKDAPLWTVDKIATATQDWFKYLADDKSVATGSPRKEAN